MGCGSSVQSTSGHQPQATKTIVEKSQTDALPSVTKAVYTVDDALKTVDNSGSSGAAPCNSGGFADHLRDLVKGTSLAETCAQKVGLGLLEAAGLFPPLTPIAFSLAALCELCKRAEDLREDCRCFASFLQGIEQALLECYGLSESDWSKRRVEWAGSQECSLLTRLGKTLDAAASYLRELQPGGDEKSSLSLSRMAARFKGILLAEEHGKTMQKLKTELQDTMSQLVVKSSLRAEKHSQVAALFASCKLEQEAAILGQVQARGGAKNCLNADGEVHQDIIDAMASQGSISTAILAEQAQTNMNKVENRLERTEQKLDLILQMMNKRPDVAGFAVPHQTPSQINDQPFQSLWTSPAHPLGGKSLQEQYPRMSQNHHTKTCESLALLKLHTEIEILEQRASQMRRALVELNRPMLSTLNTIPIGNTEAERAMNARFFRCSTLGSEMRETPRYFKAMTSFWKRFGPCTHLFSLEPHFFDEEYAWFVGPLSFRRMLGLSYAQEWLDNELLEDEKSPERQETAKFTYPANKEALTLSGGSVHPDGTPISAPDLQRAIQKLQEPERRKEVQSAWPSQHLFWSPTEENFNEKFWASKSSSSVCLMTMATGRPSIIQNFMTAEACSVDRSLDKIVARKPDRDALPWNFHLFEDQQLQHPRLNPPCTSNVLRAWFSKWASYFEGFLNGTETLNCHVLNVPVRVPHFLDVQTGNPKPRLVTVGSVCVNLFDSDPDIQALMTAESETTLTDALSEDVQEFVLGRVYCTPSKVNPWCAEDDFTNSDSFLTQTSLQQLAHQRQSEDGQYSAIYWR